MPNRNRVPTGRFIVIDGPDGAGKSTQVKLLAQRLEAEGRVVEVHRDPGSTEIGERIREILLDPTLGAMTPVAETFLYMASRSQLVAQKIKPALARGAVVLLDRFLSSTVVYQGVAGGVCKERILTLAELAIEAARPDCVVIIDVPAETGLKRLGDVHDRMEAKGLDFHRRVREGFLEFARSEPNATAVDGRGPPEEVHEKIWKALADVL